MERLIWDSQQYEEYMYRVQQMRRCLDTEGQTLADERRRILRQTDGSEDDVLGQALAKLEKIILRMDKAEERMRNLWQAMSETNDLFASTENRVRRAEIEALYTNAAEAARSHSGVPQYLRFDSPFHADAVVEPWLAAIAGEA